MCRPFRFIIAGFRFVCTDGICSPCHKCWAFRSLLSTVSLHKMPAVFAMFVSYSTMSGVPFHVPPAVIQVWANAMLYNQPGHPVHEQAKVFSRQFETKLARMTKQRKKRAPDSELAEQTVDERLQDQMLALQSQLTDVKKQVDIGKKAQTSKRSPHMSKHTS